MDRMDRPRPMLGGIIPPVCTPLTEDGEVDAESLRNLLDFLIEGGVSGLFLLGSSSEAAFLTDAQRSTVLHVAAPHVAGRVPVLAGVIDMTTPRVAAHVADALSVGVDGIVATGPFYARTHPVEIERHFRVLKDAIGDVPLFAYDVPVSTNGVHLDREMLVRLARDGVVAGLKDSSGDDAGLRRLILLKHRENLPTFSILTGSELTSETALWMGADGIVPGLGNVDPVGYVKLYDLCMTGDWGAARVEQERLCRLFPIVDVAPVSRMGRGSSAIGAFKAALCLRGIISSPTTAMPSVPLSEDEIGVVKDHLERAGLL